MLQSKLCPPHHPHLTGGKKGLKQGRRPINLVFMSLHKCITQKNAAQGEKAQSSGE